MLRYLAAATVIVLGGLAVILSLPHPPETPPGHVHYSSSSATPGPAQNGDVLGTPGAVRGEAPWALSSLPECFTQVSRRSGPSAFARRGIPAAATRIRPGTRVRVNDCLLETGSDTIAVSRGADRLVVPPHARLWRAAGSLILEREAYGRTEVRVYKLRDRAQPL